MDLIQHQYCFIVCLIPIAVIHKGYLLCFRTIRFVIMHTNKKALRVVLNATPRINLVRLYSKGFLRFQFKKNYFLTAFLEAFLAASFFSVFLVSFFSVAFLATTITVLLWRNSQALERVSLQFAYYVEQISYSSRYGISTLYSDPKSCQSILHIQRPSRKIQAQISDRLSMVVVSYCA